MTTGGTPPDAAATTGGTPPDAAVRNRDTQAILDYHEATKHSERSVRTSRHTLDWDNQPTPFKIYRDLEPVPLVRDFPKRETPALDAIAGTPGEDSRERIPDLAVLSRVLHLAAGITKRRPHPGGDRYFRAYPNTGALHHVDLYLVGGELSDLPAGVYHFGPHDFALRRLREGDWRGVLVDASGGDPELSRARPRSSPVRRPGGATAGSIRRAPGVTSSGTGGRCTPTCSPPQRPSSSSRA